MQHYKEEKAESIGLRLCVGYYESSEIKIVFTFGYESENGGRGTPLPYIR